MRAAEEMERRPAEWQDKLRSLQQWVCELLIKNQELRMALESATAQVNIRPDGERVIRLPVPTG